MTARHASGRVCAALCTDRGHTDCGAPAAGCGCACHRGSGQPCDTLGGCGVHPPDPECRGCRPRPAATGWLCARCWARLTSALDVAPGLVVYLCDLARSGGRAQGGERGEETHTKAEAPPAPGNLDAMDAASEVYALLVAEAGHAADQLGMTGPAAAPSWRAGTSAYGVPGARVGGNVAGLRAGATGREAGPYVVWLQAALPAAVEHQWVAQLVSDRGLPDGLASLATTIHRAAARYPITEAPSQVPLTRCPECTWRMLRRTPPAVPGAPTIVACANCSWTGTDDDLDLDQTATPRSATRA